MAVVAVAGEFDLFSWTLMNEQVSDIHFRFPIAVVIAMAAVAVDAVPAVAEATRVIRTSGFLSPSLVAW